LPHPELTAEVCRGAVLTELAFRGQLVASSDDSELDSTPTGLAIVDELLAEVVAHPDRTMEHWIRLGRPHLHEMVAELVAEGCWRIERHSLTTKQARYVDNEQQRMMSALARLRQVGSGAEDPATPRHAALTVYAGLIGALPAISADRRAELLTACGEISWMVQAVIDYVDMHQQEDQAAGRVNTATMGAQIISI
jgi:hypothetical protein